VTTCSGFNDNKLVDKMIDWLIIRFITRDSTQC